MEFPHFLKTLIVFSFMSSAMADTIYCAGGTKICQGNSPYCCILDSGEEGCCWDSFVYEMWWFWLVWVIAFFLLMGCSLACWRRRQRRMRYVVMASSEYPTYGTVVSTGTVVTAATPHGAPVATSGGAAATAPVAPPSYASVPSYATKPPPYSG